MTFQDELRQVKSGAATLMACLVRTLQMSDPDFQDKFLENLDRARTYSERNPGKRADGSPHEVQNVLEMLSWTREILTGCNNVTGEREPFLPPE